MQMRTIWMCQDLSDPSQTGFGLTKKTAEDLVARNRRYDSPHECFTDELALPAVQVELPYDASVILLKNLR